MNTISLNIQSKPSSKKRTIVVEMDADRLERLAADFGLLNPDFLKSVARAEEDYRRGRVYDIKSLEELRDKDR